MQVESVDTTWAEFEPTIARAKREEKTDEQIVVDAMQGSRDAFQILFERYEKRMFRVAVRVLRNREDAEDAVQQAFERAYVHLSSFQGNSRFSTWLTRITINESLMLLRKRRPGHLSLEGNKIVEEEEMTLEIEDAAATPEERSETRELHTILKTAIGELKPILSEVVQLLDINEMTTTETAEILGLPRGTIKARAFRARRLLRGKLVRRMGLGSDKTSGSLFLKLRAGRGNRRQASSFATAT